LPRRLKPFGPWQGAVGECWGIERAIEAKDLDGQAEKMKQWLVEQALLFLEQPKKRRR
jgi:hypothetical protein